MGKYLTSNVRYLPEGYMPVQFIPVSLSSPGLLQVKVQMNSRSRGQGSRLGRRDLVDFRLPIQGEVLGYLYEMKQEGVYMVTSKHLDMEQGGRRKGTRSIK